jgi:hypothetical protein
LEAIGRYLNLDVKDFRPLKGFRPVNSEENKLIDVLVNEGWEWDRLRAALPIMTSGPMLWRGENVVTPGSDQYFGHSSISIDDFS